MHSCPLTKRRKMEINKFSKFELIMTLVWARLLNKMKPEIKRELKKRKNEISHKNLHI